ncbi:hypothetical protein TWF506_003107 [Arthrobotrys conoides]|uniref:Uncharacterized protein n=1 Tax=Arthrobotrys conoides TaxID=74498 RepID=A0AAN8RQZ2_9PEZI
MAPYVFSLSLLLLSSATVTLARPFQSPDILGPLKVFPAGGDPVYTGVDNLVKPKKEPKLIPRGFDPSAIAGAVHGGNTPLHNPSNLGGVLEAIGSPESSKVTPENLASGSAADGEVIGGSSTGALTKDFEPENVKAKLLQLLKKGGDLNTNEISAENQPRLIPREPLPGDVGLPEIPAALPNLSPAEIVSNTKPVLKEVGANFLKNGEAPAPEGSKNPKIRARKPLRLPGMEQNFGKTDGGLGNLLVPREITDAIKGSVKPLLAQNELPLPIPKLKRRKPLSVPGTDGLGRLGGFNVPQNLDANQLTKSTDEIIKPLAQNGLPLPKDSKLKARTPLAVPGLDGLSGLGLDKIVDPKRILRVQDEVIQPLLANSGLPLTPTATKLKRELPLVSGLNLTDEELFEYLTYFIVRYATNEDE